MTIEPRLLGLLAPLFVASGCFASHTIPLPGERYQCQCRYTDELPEITVTCDLDPSDPSCGGVRFGSDPAERTHTATIFPCAVFEGEANDVCDAACANEVYFPNTSTATGVRQGEGVHSGQGMCATNDDPPREFFFPDVPLDAVRNGRVVAELSSIELSLEGLGSTGMFQPVDGTLVSIRGGTCEGVSCSLSINSFDVEVPGGTMLDGHAVDDLRIFLSASAEDEVEAEADGMGAWRMRATTVENSGLPLEFGGRVNGEREGAPFTWERPASNPDDGPGGELDLGRTSPDPHMTFDGVIRGNVELDDGSMVAAEVSASIFVRFFSGSPVPRAMMGVGAAGEPLTLDASASYDGLGGDIAEYEWLAVRGTDEFLLATGVRTALHPSVLDGLHNSGFELCLRTYDTDGQFDTVCEGSDAFVEDPDVPPATCAEAILTPASNRRYAELVENAGLTRVLDYPNVTWLVPNNAAFEELDAAAVHNIVVHPSVMADLVLDHALPGTHPVSSLVTQELPTLGGGGLVVTGPALGHAVAVPDLNCGGSIVHQVDRVLDRLPGR